MYVLRVFHTQYKTFQEVPNSVYFNAICLNNYEVRLLETPDNSDENHKENNPNVTKHEDN